MNERVYDTVIIGGGPAGYTAALYAARAGLQTLVLEKFSAGGQMTQTWQIDNYPGFADGIDGFTLGQNMQQGAARFGAETVQTEVLDVDLKAKPKRIFTDNGVYLAKTVIIATGASHKKLGIEREESLTGRGVAYCAACDGMFYKGKTVAVVGGGNSAVADALLLSRVAKKVYVIHRRDTLKATKVYHEPLMRSENVEFKWNSEVQALLGEERLSGVVLSNKNGQTEELKIDGLFVSIGQNPVTELFKNQLLLNENGYIPAGETTQTEIPGVYAVGDVRTKMVRQIITAAADGAVAAHYAQEHLGSLQI